MMPLETNYSFVERLGVGAQATVDIIQEVTETGKRKYRAVKTYKRPPPQGIQQMYAEQDETNFEEWQVKNEVLFLRQLRTCRNIIKLRAVYESEQCY